MNPLFYGLFASGAVHHDRHQMIAAVAGLVGCTAIRQALGSIGSSGWLKVLENVGGAFILRTSRTIGSIETLDHLESPELLDKLQMFRDYTGGVFQTIMSLFSLLNVLATSTVTLVVALSADWRLITLVLLGIPRLLLAPRTLRWDRAIEEEGSPYSRQLDLLVDLTHEVDAGAEARVFGLQSELRRQIAVAVREWQAPAIRYARKYTLLELANGTAYFGTAVAIIGWMLHDTLHGTVGIQAFTVAITAIGALQGISASLVGTVKSTAQSMRAAVRYLWLQDYAEEIRARYAGTQNPPAQLGQGVSLKDLTFRYSGASSDALNGIDLDLPAGSVVALVGENGAGKTTLAKLLTGMYAPTAGRIEIDGTDLADIHLEKWRSRCAGAFQDHSTFEFTAGRAIGIGDLTGGLDDEAEIRRALEDAAAADILTTLPDGLDTQLGTAWPGGVDLSGGQWQRIAIARGMMRRQPLLLVLDEPTSALDAHTEHALFDRYTAAAAAGRRTGAVTVLVTHRFSTVAAADLVVVLRHGGIVETGTHTQLLAAGGHYAELYGMQASGYT
ncbi:MAG TPA: ABC transporter ATP-binding protein [Mycobacteriales bacterium]|nr:ABC transporter ATP-binding protein [Mycobacteriales bacterium]